MPYTKNTPDRTHAMQWANPKDPGELTLAVTLEALAYVARASKANYKLLSGVMGAFSMTENRLTGARDITAPSNPAQLATKMVHLVDKYSRNFRLTPMQEETRGAIRCASMEFYRRMLVDYEEKKIKENGDVFPVREKLPTVVKAKKKAGRPKKEETTNEKETV